MTKQFCSASARTCLPSSSVCDSLCFTRDLVSLLAVWTRVFSRRTLTLTWMPSRCVLRIYAVLVRKHVTITARRKKKKVKITKYHIILRRQHHQNFHSNTLQYNRSVEPADAVDSHHVTWSSAQFYYLAVSQIMKFPNQLACIISLFAVTLLVVVAVSERF